MRIQDDTEESATAGQAATVGEERVVGEDGADASEKRVTGVAHSVDFGARFLRGNPLEFLAFA